MEMPLELPPEPELLSLEAVHRYQGVPQWGSPRLGPQLTVLDLYRAVALELQANREPDFNSLVSPLSPRWMAARVFYLLLGECAHMYGGDTQARDHCRDPPPDQPLFLS